MDEHIDQMVDDSELDERTVQRYERQIRNGEKMPAIVLWIDNGQLRILDGFHRFEAMKRCGIKHISGCYVLNTPPDLVPELRQALNRHDDN